MHGLVERFNSRPGSDGGKRCSYHLPLEKTFNQLDFVELPRVDTQLFKVVGGVAHRRARPLVDEHEGVARDRWFKRFFKVGIHLREQLFGRQPKSIAHAT